MNFLKDRTNRAIRREIRDIMDSYHHYWDPIAELLQNSRDAIERTQQSGAIDQKFIRISVDAASRTIEILDNGVGIPRGKVSEILAPGGGDKDENDDEVGEKGVGLTYTIFCGSKFEIESRSRDGEHFGGIINGARKWLDSTDPEQLPPEYEDLEKGTLPHGNKPIEIEGTTYSIDTFTRIKISEIPPSEYAQDIFGLTGTQLKFLLSTRTSVGVTNKLFDDTFTPKFNFYYQFNLGAGAAASSDNLIVGYPPPHTYVSKSYRRQEVTSAFIVRTSPKARRKYLKDAAIWDTSQVKNGDETIRVYGVMMPGNNVFENLSKGTLNLLDSDSSDDSEDTLFRAGIFLATKNMPTGVEIPNGTGGKYPAYYRRCLFIVESNRIKFDLGRKSMHWQPKRRLQQAVTEMFKGFEDLATYQSDERARPSSGAEPQETKPEREARKKAEWEKYKGLVDLNITKLKFQKIPNGQEAGVAAIFHEMLGANLLKQYAPLSTGYSSRYDLHAIYTDINKKKKFELVIEFKHSLETLIKDLVDERKFLDDIHLLVAWDGDKQKLKDADFTLDDRLDKPYEGVTHELTFPTSGMDPIPVILLEDRLNIIKSSLTPVP